MLSPVINTKTVHLQSPSSGTTVTLPEAAIYVSAVALVTGSGTALATAVEQTVVSGTPSSGDVQFTGTAIAPSATLTFAASVLGVNDWLVVTYAPKGAIPAAA